MRGLTRDTLVSDVSWQGYPVSARVEVGGGRGRTMGRIRVDTGAVTASCMVPHTHSDLTPLLLLSYKARPVCMGGTSAHISG